MKNAPYNAPDLALSAITIRGIGPYIHGARLEIRPLTIICGENGSGKSTWFKVLRVLRDSLQDGSLPFGLNVAGKVMTNAFFRSFEMEEDGEFKQNPNFDHPFGPPGTIGLEFIATRDIDIKSKLGHGSRWDVLGTDGVWQKGTKFRFRISSPVYVRSDTPKHMCSFTELTVGQTTIRFIAKPWIMECAGDNVPRESSWSMYLKRPSMEWEWLCWFDEKRRVIAQNEDYSTSFGFDDNDTPEEQMDKLVYASKNRPEIDARDLSHNFGLQVRKLLTPLLDTVFHIGALRDIEHRADFDPAERDFELHQKTRQRRHVGERGEFAWLMYDVAANSEFRKRELAPFNPEDFDHTSFDFDDQFTQKVFEDLNSEQLALLKEATTNSSNKTNENIRAILSDSFNSFVERRPMVESEIPGEVEDDREFNALKSRFGSLTISESRKLHSLTMVYWYSELRHQADRLNARELLGMLGPSPRGFSRLPWTSMTEYLSTWMKHLTGQSLGKNYEHYDVFIPVDVAQNPVFMEQIGQITKDFRGSENSLNRVLHPCFGEGDFWHPQSPQRFSSGFHQLFPIIMQVSVMKPFEVVTVENPEVHLHPSLIVKLTEFLIEAGKNNRGLMVETHSDLLVLRVVRAVLEESISQEDVRVYFIGHDTFGPIEYQAVFTREEEEMVPAGQDVYPNDASPDELPFYYEYTKNCKATFQCAKLEPIQFDANRQVVNWPKGFLDAELEESQKMLRNVTFNGIEENGGDGDEEE